MKNRILRIIIATLLTMIIGLSGIFVPGIVLKKTNSTTLNTATRLSDEYYSHSSTAISRNASAQLSDYQKMMLISGAWESTITEADIAESYLTEYEAINMAQKAVDRLYENGNYPCQLSSSFKNWYTWTATLYKAIDTSFHTYTAYYWKLTFDSYDTEEHHTVLMMEDGTLLCAYTNVHYLITTVIVTYFKNSYLGSKSAFVGYNADITTLPRYADIEIPESRLRIKKNAIMVVGNKDLYSITQVQNAYNDPDTTSEFYCIYQLISRYVYMYTMIPYQP